MKLRIYLDTSVISACGDARLPQRRAETLAFFKRRNQFEFVTSTLAEVEIRRTSDPKRLEEILVLLKSIPQIAVTSEMEELDRSYLKESIFPAKQAEDALHVAAAVVSGISILVSWNFRHLVNRRRRSKVLAANAHLGYPPIEIIPPPEV